MQKLIKWLVPFFLITTQAVSASADDELSVSANLSFVSDYRFRGVSLSDEDVAIQGGIDLTYDGFYAGAWGSSIESFNGAETEVDIYGGYGNSFAGIDWSIGYLAFLFPGADNSNYVELTGVASKDLGLAAISLGVNYAPDQSHIGNKDNLYLYGGVSAAIPATPISLVGGLGYEDGAFGDKKLDWSLGAAADFFGLTFSLKYIDTNAGDQFGSNADETVVFSIGASF